jgi:hypothetical protein
MIASTMRWPPHRPAPFWNERRYARADDPLIVKLDRPVLREARSRNGRCRAESRVALTHDPAGLSTTDHPDHPVSSGAFDASAQSTHYDSLRSHKHR